jgi:hypothetical protein
MDVSEQETVGIWDQALLQPIGVSLGKLQWSPSRGAAVPIPLRTHPLPQPTASSLVVESLFLSKRWKGT